MRDNLAALMILVMEKYCILKHDFSNVLNLSYAALCKWTSPKYCIVISRTSAFYKRYFDINMREKKPSEMGTAISADESYNQIQPYMIWHALHEDTFKTYHSSGLRSGHGRHQHCSSQIVSLAGFSAFSCVCCSLSSVATAPCERPWVCIR